MNFSKKYKDNYIFTCKEALEKKILKNISSMDEIASKCLDICRKTMGSESLKDTVTKKNRVNIMKDYPKNSRLLILNGEIIGFWFLVSLKEKQFELAKEGKFHEKAITKKNIVDLNNEPIGEECKGYFVDIAILKQYQAIEGSKYFKLLLKSFVEQIEIYARKEKIFFTEWCAVASTEQGKKFCKRFGLDEIDCEYCVENEKVYYAKYEDIKTYLDNNIGKLKILGVEKIYLRLTTQYDNYLGKALEEKEKLVLASKTILENKQYGIFNFVFNFNNMKNNWKIGSSNLTRTQIVIGLVFGIVTGYLIFSYPNLTGMQYFFCRVFLSLGITLIGSAFLEGTVKINWTIKRMLSVKAFGWLAIFILLYYFNPPAAPMP